MLLSGFCATGIYPFNKNKVLDRLPREDDANEREIESTLTTFLRESRYGSSSIQPAQKKKRFGVAPGKSIATRDFDVTTDSHQLNDQEQYDIASTSNAEPNQVVPGYRNNEEEQEDKSNIDDNLNEEEDEETECKEGRYDLANFFSRRKQIYKYVCQITQIDPLLVEGYKSLDNKGNFKRIPKDV